VSARKAVLTLSAAFGLGLLTPTVAPAQEFGLGLGAGYFDFTQSPNSTKAVLGSSGGFTFGGDLRLQLTEHLYLGAGLRYFKKTGQRVFVSSPSGTVFPLKNEPLTARILPAELTLGYRFATRGSLVPYLGIGPGVAFYHEESTVGGITSTLDETKVSGHAVAGLEFGRGEVRFGLEVNYSIVPNAIGVGGVSQIYNEKDIGGLAILGRIVFTSPRH
jgi:opacity protein-like surface antigen